MLFRKILGQVRRLPSWYRSTFFQKCVFFHREGYWPNIYNPRHIKEVIFRNRICSDGSLSDYMDKDKAKDIIDTFNKKYKINLKYARSLQVVKRPQDIDFTLLNTACFIKGTHGCAMNILYEPGKTEEEYILKQASKWLEVDYYKEYGEMNYVGVEKKILVEELLCDESKESLYDVKVHCLKGVPIAIQIIYRGNGVLERKTYNSNWEEKRWFVNEILEVDLADRLKKKIIKNAKILSAGFDYVRIDFFLVDLKELYFAEFTFTPSGVYMPLVNSKIDEELYNIYKMSDFKG